MPTGDQLQALAGIFGLDMSALVAELVVDNDVERALLQDPLLRPDDQQALLTLYRSITRGGVAAR